MKRKEEKRDNDATRQRQEWFLATLEQLLELPVTEVTTTLNQTAQRVAEVLAADKVDIFFHDSITDTLVSLRSSDTPMTRHHFPIEPDRLPLADGGRIVETFLTGTSYITGHVEQDADELVGIKNDQRMQSEIAVMFKVQQQNRGVLIAASATPDFFSPQDLRFLEAVRRWIGIVLGRTEQVERMRQEAVEQGRRLAAEELLTIMTHDLRNYLTPLQGRLELLEQRAHQEKRERDLHDIGAMEHTLGLLDRMISDLLDMARLNEGTFVVTPQVMNLMDVVQETIPTFQSAETPIHVHAPTKVILAADPDRLRQVLENLLANALNYAPKQTPILVYITLERRLDGAWVLLTVKNQGPGIPPERRATLFQPFVTGTKSGVNLGLYLANRIAQAHHGTLTVASSTNQGVAITLAVPVEEDEVNIKE